MPETDDKAGLCPLCQEKMHQKDGFVVCPNGDYKAEFGKWDTFWTELNVLKDDFVKKYNKLLELNLVEAGS
jgi:hypothetical protein